MRSKSASTPLAPPWNTEPKAMVLWPRLMMLYSRRTSPTLPTRPSGASSVVLPSSSMVVPVGRPWLRTLSVLPLRSAVVTV